MNGKPILCAWLGTTDINASKGSKEHMPGPILKVLQSGKYEEIHILSDEQFEWKQYETWLNEQETGARAFVHPVPLSDPNSFDQIYEQAQPLLDKLKEQSKEELSFTFQLSSGTPAMATIWVILSKTRHPATLVECSGKTEVRTQPFHFDLAAELALPYATEKAETWQRLAEGLPKDPQGFQDILGKSEALEKCKTLAHQAALKPVPVLFLGESGTGKELFAQAIHKSSPWSAGDFVPVNCGAIPRELVTSELFGYVKGAFTGAHHDKKGAFARADKGTLFLDEIGELPLDAQVHLLRALQEKKYQPLGSGKEQKSDFRLVCATNRDLLQEVEKGNFREDLYYRIAVAVVSLPPLRNRAKDPELLIASFLEKTQKEMAVPQDQFKEISKSGKILLTQHPWPGNVRELQNVITRLVLWTPGKKIEKSDVREALGDFSSARNILDLLPPLSPGFNLDDFYLKIDKHYIQEALEKSQGNRSEAARKLGFKNPNTLKNRLKKAKEA